MTSRTAWLVGVAVTAQLLAAGCEGGGGGSGFLSSLFGGGSGSSEALDVLGASGSGDGDTSGDVASLFSSGSDTGSGSGGSGSGGINPASVHMPEPGSLVLFGSGLVGATLLHRRRKTHKRSSSK